MGEAKKRRDAMAWGTPWKQDFHRCPRCRSRRTFVDIAPPMALSHVPTRYGACGDCKALWEAYPDDWDHDAVAASPCDNCAFAKGSPESTDREGWLDLVANLKMGGQFFCHKGSPLLVDEDAMTIEFDRDWINAHGRSCAGFVKAMAKWPDWLDNHFSVALSKRDQGRAMGGDE